ncbi:MAG TPA: alpha/beta family hydrolase [Thermoanaerobaculia bacterium]|nr:alpha/beta family hydrolase [Thermoanaerobaculia bacterium]
MSDERELRFDSGAGEVSALLRRPPHAWALFVCGHGAGAGMRHPFLAAVADRLAERGVATLRYQFPYMEAGSRRPDHRPVLLATVAAADRAAADAAGDLPRLAGGKSMGGRMASHAAADGLLPEACGLVFLGFPLHPAGRPSTERAAHLPRVPCGMLFLQGTRDKLADLALLRPVLAPLAERATLHVVDGGDHSFGVLKRSGREGEEVLDELAEATARWARRVLGG